jgi:hypothetical protein
MRAALISSLILTCLALPVQAREGAADDATASAKSHFAAGRAAVKRHQYEEAMREFEAGYRLKPSPLFLYNIGQVARQAGLPARALDAFEAYLHAAPAAADRAEVQRWIVQLRETVEHDRATAAAAHANDPPAPAAAATAAAAPASSPSLALSPASAAPPPAGSPSAGAPASGASATALTSAPPPPPRRARRTLWIALGSVGGALVLGGVATAIALGTRNNSGTPSGFHDLGMLNLGSH